MPKLYQILHKGETIQSRKKGVLAGWKKGKIFGTLECSSGMKMHAINRVFFDSLEGAIQNGYRPCKKCMPLDEAAFETIKHLVPYATLEEFYNS